LGSHDHTASVAAAGGEPNGRQREQALEDGRRDARFRERLLST